MRSTSMSARAIAWARNNTAAAVIASAMTLVGVITVGAVLAGMNDLEGPTPSPIATATPTRTPDPTAAPTLPPATPTLPPGTPEPSIGGLTDPTPQEAALLALIPAPYASSASCGRYEQPYAGSDAMIRCSTPSGANAVFYTSYATTDQARAAFNGIVGEAGVARGGRCADGIPANNPWTWETIPPGGTPFPDDGDLACYTRVDDAGNPVAGVQYVWTHLETRILASWLAPDSSSGLKFWSAWVSAVDR